MFGFHKWKNENKKLNIWNPETNRYVSKIIQHRTCIRCDVKQKKSIPYGNMSKWVTYK